MICKVGIKVNGQIYGIVTSMRKSKSLARALIVLTDIKGTEDTVYNSIIDKEEDYANVIYLDEQRKKLLYNIAEYMAMDHNYNMTVSNIVLTQRTGIILHFITYNAFADGGYIKQKVNLLEEREVEIVLGVEVQKEKSQAGTEYWANIWVHYDV